MRLGVTDTWGGNFFRGGKISCWCDDDENINQINNDNSKDNNDHYHDDDDGISFITIFIVLLPWFLIIFVAFAFTILNILISIAINVSIITIVLFFYPNKYSCKYDRY